jgi:hypothetical protein
MRNKVNTKILLAKTEHLGSELSWSAVCRSGSIRKRAFIELTTREFNFTLNFPYVHVHEPKMRKWHLVFDSNIYPLVEEMTFALAMCRLRYRAGSSYWYQSIPCDADNCQPIRILGDDTTGSVSIDGPDSTTVYDLKGVYTRSTEKLVPGY